MLFNLAPSWSKPHAVRVLRGAANNKTQPEENELDSAEQTTQLRPHTTISVIYPEYTRWLLSSEGVYVLEINKYCVYYFWFPIQIEI